MHVVQNHPTLPREGPKSWDWFVLEFGRVGVEPTLPKGWYWNRFFGTSIFFVEFGNLTKGPKKVSSPPWPQFLSGWIPFVKVSNWEEWNIKYLFWKWIFATIGNEFKIKTLLTRIFFMTNWNNSGINLFFLKNISKIKIGWNLMKRMAFISFHQVKYFFKEQNILPGKIYTSRKLDLNSKTNFENTLFKMSWNWEQVSKYISNLLFLLSRVFFLNKL